MLFLYFAVSFLLGTFPSAHIISSLHGVNIKRIGSGNAGATNVLRSIGWKPGIIVLFFDVIKGIIPFVMFPFFDIQESRIANEWIPMLGGMCSILGHIFNPFLKFDGGKGIATSAGVYLYLIPVPCLMTAVVGLVVVYWKKIASLGSIIGFFFLPIFYLGYARESYSPKVLSLVIFNFFLVLFTHRQNIKRIIDGKELSFKNKKHGN